MLRGKGGLIGIQPDLDNLLNANSVWELSPKWRGFLEWEGILEREGPEKPLPDDSWKEER